MWPALIAAGASLLGSATQPSTGAELAKPRERMPRQQFTLSNPYADKRGLLGDRGLGESLIANRLQPRDFNLSGPSSQGLTGQPSSYGLLGGSERPAEKTQDAKKGDGVGTSMMLTLAQAMPTIMQGMKSPTVPFVGGRTAGAKPMIQTPWAYPQSRPFASRLGGMLGR